MIISEKGVNFLTSRWRRKDLVSAVFRTLRNEKKRTHQNVNVHFLIPNFGYFGQVLLVSGLKLWLYKSPLTNK